MDQSHGYANYALFGAEWLRKNVDPNRTENPFTNPDFSEQRKRQLADRLSVDWIYGGWMEDRSIIWSDTYLKEAAAFLHLGVDLTVPAGTLVNALATSEILYTGTDVPFVGGWGGHVIQRYDYRGEEAILIYAHLGEIRVTIGDVCEKGVVIGAVGDKTQNGFWSPHLHVQIVRDVGNVTDWKHFLDVELDGYGKAAEIEYWSSKCPDPTPLFFQ